jgi:hypothetical protein
MATGAARLGSPVVDLPAGPRVFWPSPVEAEWVLIHAENPPRWVLYRVEEGDAVSSVLEYPAGRLEEADLMNRVAEHTGPEPAEAMVTAFFNSHGHYFVNPTDGV